MTTATVIWVIIALICAIAGYAVGYFTGEKDGIHALCEDLLEEIMQATEEGKDTGMLKIEADGSLHGVEDQEDFMDVYGEYLKEHGKKIVDIVEGDNDEKENE